MPLPTTFVRSRQRIQRLREALWNIHATRANTAELLAMAAESAIAAREAEHALVALRAELAHASAVATEGTRVASDAVRGMDAARAAAVAELTQGLEACRADLAALRQEVTRDHERLLLGLRVVRDDDDQARDVLTALRSSQAYELAFDDPEPLVSIIITTYRNWPLLRDRCLPSVLAQTYERWEAIVVGDAAPDEARRVVESFGDGRIRFANLPYRGPYPSDPLDAWHMSGTAPWNTGLELAQGTWIGANSDDDALRPTSIEALLRHAREEHAEVPYGALDARIPDRPSEKVGVFPPVRGQWGMQAALFHGALRYLRLQPSDWVFGVPNDAALLERMLRIGVRFAYLDEPVVDYYPSRLWSEREQRLTRREAF
jgi:hypothetical protein